MKLDNSVVAALAFLSALDVALLVTPLARFLAKRFNIYDVPRTAVKTHKEPVPYLGGTAIFVGFALSLVLIRFLTSFPTGTLRSLRGIMAGGTIVFALGIFDDLKTDGLHYRTKFFFQIIAACMVAHFGVRIKFINPPWFAYVVTIVWIVGITNAFNLIDIMDGLASGVAFIATMAFVFIALPTEELYVNLGAAALGGAALGFMPYNLSKRLRIFMGDGGSLFLGFVCSALALGTSYGHQNEWGILAPLMILCPAIYDTLLVFIARIRRGVSPFIGSKDHFALRLEILGWKRPKILVYTLGMSAFLSLGAYAVTRVPSGFELVVYFFTILLLLALSAYLSKAKVQ